MILNKDNFLKLQAACFTFALPGFSFTDHKCCNTNAVMLLSLENHLYPHFSVQHLRLWLLFLLGSKTGSNFSAAGGKLQIPEHFYTSSQLKHELHPVCLPACLLLTVTSISWEIFKDPSFYLHTTLPDFFLPT